MLVGISSLGYAHFWLFRLRGRRPGAIFDRFGHGFLACGWIPGGLVIPIHSIYAILHGLLPGLLLTLRIFVFGAGSSCSQPIFCIIQPLRTRNSTEIAVVFSRPLRFYTYNLPRLQEGCRLEVFLFLFVSSRLGV